MNLNMNMLTIVLSFVFYILTFSLYNTALTCPQNYKELVFHMNEFISNKNYKDTPKKGVNHLNIALNNSYCKLSDFYKITHPDVIQSDTYTFTDKDGMYKTPQKKKNSQIQLPQELSVIFHYGNQFTSLFDVGISGMCLFQKLNHLPNGNLITNQYLINAIQNHIFQQSINNLPYKCIVNSSIYIDQQSFNIMPPTYRLYIKEECDLLKNKLGKEDKKYLLKDYFLPYVDFLLYLDECETYKNLNIVAQEYVMNPLQYFGFKVEFRVYWMIASTKHLQVYVYDQILIRQCEQEFLMNNLLSHNCKKSSTNESNYIEISIEDFCDYLIDIEKINSKKWIYQYLYPQIDKIIIQIVRSIEKKLVQDSKFSQIYQSDIVIDENLNLWLISNDEYQEFISEWEDDYLYQYQQKLTKDIMEIIVKYNKSKFQRIRNVIQQVYQKMKQLNQTFKQATTKQHYRLLKSAYEDISIHMDVDNKFRRIVDGSQRWGLKYNNIIDNDCIQK